jgi:hypothetical protein
MRAAGAAVVVEDEVPGAWFIPSDVTHVDFSDPFDLPNDVSDQVAAAILDLRLNSIEEINLKNTRVSSELLARIRDRLPESAALVGPQGEPIGPHRVNADGENGK